MRYKLEYQAPLKYIKPKFQGGRIDIENINIDVEPSAPYYPLYEKIENRGVGSDDRVGSDDDGRCVTEEEYKTHCPSLFESEKWEYGDEEEDEEIEDKDEEMEDDKNKKDNEKIFTTNPTDIIKECLLNFEQSGLFSCGGSINDAPLPGIFINDIGFLGLPLEEEKAQSIIKKCTMAPFGRKDKTILDTSVRHTWQLEPSQFSIKNSRWELMMKRVVYHVSAKLGCNSQSVKHSLYKLLIYGPGSFFKPHSDSEKEDRMFGTLIIILPSIYSGGQLVVYHNKKVCEYDFNDDIASSLKTNYASFYADCEHEIKPITTGYRVCLVYNLIKTSPNIMSTIIDDTISIQKIAKAVNEWAVSTEDNCPKFLIYGLEHRYTNRGLSFGGLKGKDVATLQILKSVSELVPLDIYLVNMQRCTYQDFEDGEKSIDTEITIWVSETDRARSIKCPIYDDDVIQKYFWKGKRIDEEDKGTTGNESTSISRYYHHTGIIFWPPQFKHHIYVRDMTRVNEYLKTLQKESDIQEVLPLILKRFDQVKYRRKYGLKNIDCIIDCCSRAPPTFDCRNQIMDIMNVIEQYVGTSDDICSNDYLLSIVRKIHALIPTISATSTFRNIVSYMIWMFRCEFEACDDEQICDECISELRNMLDSGFPKEIEPLEERLTHTTL